MLFAIEGFSWSVETWVTVLGSSVAVIGFAFKMGARLSAIESKIDSFAAQLLGLQKTSENTSASVHQIALTLQAHESRLTAVEREQDRINRERYVRPAPTT